MARVIPRQPAINFPLPVIAGSGSVNLLNWLSSISLLYADGVEPAEAVADLFPLQGGRRAWYIDADAVSNGDGSEGSPYNSFDELNAGTASGYAQGDHIYVTGDFTAAKHATRDMGLVITSASRLGSTTNPTVLRSWPGQARAKFDGSYTAACGIYIDPSTNDGTRGFVVINVEVTRCNSSGSIIIGAGSNSAGVAYQRIISCWIHHNYSLSGGPNSNYGGAYMVAKAVACDIGASHNLTHDNNTSDGTTVSVDNNTGGLSLLSEQDATGTVAVFEYNLQFNEHLAIRHKHDGDVTFTSRYNYAYNCTHHHYLRVSTENNIHHCIFRDGAEDYSAFIVQEAENQAALRTVNAYSNTVVRVARFVSDGDTNFTFNDILNAYQNIHYYRSATIEGVVLGAYSDRNYYTAGASFDDSVMYLNSSSTFWLNNGTTKSQAQFDTQFGAGNVYSDPLFTDLAGNDFTLQPGSPALSVNGNRAGAL